MKYLKLFILIGILFAAPVSAMERTYIIPTEITDQKETSLLLNGNWQFRFSDKSKWTTIRVPGEAAMQGYAIEHDKPFWYKKSFTIPRHFNGKRIILRFDGVYSHAKLTVNGRYVREHHGGFTRWETDITDYAKPGAKNEILLEVTDRLDEISYASGYAHHPIGGILRDVTLFILPQTHLYDFFVETHLDSLYQDAVLKLTYGGEISQDAEIEYTLTDPTGKKVSLTRQTFPLKKENKNFTNEIPVGNPMKWDAEHPHLYQLTATIKQDGKEINTINKRIGFREVKVKGDKLLVNGMPVKLRGACRHDIHPTLGRTTTAELDSLDVILFKKSNMNFVRTSHYPPSENFLAYCDQFGLYVECETAVCFVDTYRQKNYAPGRSQDAPDFKERYLSQYREMVKSFYSHPSILFWSIGNESVYGTNFQACWDWSKATDKTRPVIFSYPGSVKNEDKIYDILSMHYQDVHGNVNQWGMSTRGFQGHGIPALFDEWAHPACYTYSTLQEDPNIREFWGQSLDMMWDGLFNAPGGLGGAIWGYIDEIFMLPQPQIGTSYWKEFARTAKPENYQGDCVGYGEWGIVDIWRRQKPEFWATQKAYSPVKIVTRQINDFKPFQRLFITVFNRFDHTNLNEVKITYTYKGKEKDIFVPSLDPHNKGILILPEEDWAGSEKILIRIYSATDELIDAEQILLGEEKIDFPQTGHKGKLTVTETGEQVIIRGNNFEIPFIKATGLIHNAVSNGQIIIEKGPFLNMDINLNHLTGAEVRKSADKYLVSDTDWRVKDFSWEKKEDNILVTLTGTYKGIHLDMQLLFTPEGKMEIDYFTQGEPNGYLRETGLTFYLPETLNHLKWKRKGYWSFYPENEFAGNDGEVSLYATQQVGYAQKPIQPWYSDTRNYFYWANEGANCQRPLTQMGKGMKENIWYYALSADNRKDSGFSVISKDASLACRTNKKANEQLILYVNTRWDYPEIAWGNYCKTIETVPNYGKITLQF